MKENSFLHRSSGCSEVYNHEKFFREKVLFQAQ